MKKWLALALLVCLFVTVFTGCSSKTTEEPAATEAPAVTEEPVATEEPEPAAWPDSEELAWCPKWDKVPDSVTTIDTRCTITYENATLEDYEAYKAILEAADNITISSDMAMRSGSMLNAHPNDTNDLKIAMNYTTATNKLEIAITFVIVETKISSHV